MLTLQNTSNLPKSPSNTGEDKLLQAFEESFKRNVAPKVKICQEKIAEANRTIADCDSKIADYDKGIALGRAMQADADQKLKQIQDEADQKLKVARDAADQKLQAARDAANQKLKAAEEKAARDSKIVLTNIFYYVLHQKKPPVTQLDSLFATYLASGDLTVEKGADKKSYAQVNSTKAFKRYIKDHPNEIETLDFKYLYAHINDVPGIAKFLAKPICPIKTVYISPNVSGMESLRNAEKLREGKLKINPQDSKI